MSFVERYPDNATGDGITPGAVKGVYAWRQPGYAEEELSDDHPEVIVFFEFLKSLREKKD